MKCPHCGNESTESYKFCVKCGKSINQNEATTEIFPKPDPYIDLRAIRKSSLKCALGLGLSALGIHFLVIFFAPQLNVSNKIDPAHDAPTIYFVQAIIAGLFLLFLFTPMGVPSKGKIPWSNIARDTFHQFLKGWSAIWVSWFLLYLYMGVVLLVANDASAAQNLALQITVDFLNVSNSAAFFYLFLVLDMPSVSTRHHPDRNKEFEKGFIAVASICFLVFVFSSFNRANPGLGNLGIYVSGLLVAISMAYVFGRLDSHYMNVNRWMLAPLYLYAVIQVSGPDLVDYSGVSKDTQQKVFFGTVLVLKIYLFIVVYHWLQNGHFEKYFNTASDRIEDGRSKR